MKYQVDIETNKIPFSDTPILKPTCSTAPQEILF